MIKDPASELCIISQQANALRASIALVTHNFNTISPKCEYHLPDKLCCSENNTRGRKCNIHCCPITELKKPIRRISDG